MYLRVRYVCFAYSTFIVFVYMSSFIVLVVHRTNYPMSKQQVAKSTHDKMAGDKMVAMKGGTC